MDTALIMTVGAGILLTGILIGRWMESQWEQGNDTQNEDYRDYP